MPLIKITSDDRGKTIATNGTLTNIFFLKAPTEYRRPFQLVDGSIGGPLKSLYCEDVSTSTRTPGPHPLYSHVLLEGSLPFGNLTVYCPGGAEFEVIIA